MFGIRISSDHLTPILRLTSSFGNIYYHYHIIKNADELKNHRGQLYNGHAVKNYGKNLIFDQMSCSCSNQLNRIKTIIRVPSYID